MKWHMSGAAAALVLTVAGPALAAGALGQFIDHRDIGKPGHPGAASYDAATGTYRVTGGGSNMWTNKDDFHFVWKKMSGDVRATTDAIFFSPSPAPGAPGYIHRKGGIILRQDLDTDSAYVDALRMGNQQLSLQYRETKGGLTHLIWINTPYQGAVRLEKIGDYAYLSVPGADGKLHHAGGSFKLRIVGPYYIGVGVCPHDNTVTETMDFAHVKIEPIASPPAKGAMETTLQTMQAQNGFEQTAVYTAAGPIKSPAWSSDGKSLLFEKDGKLSRIAADGGPAATIETGGAQPAADDRGVSPDGKWIYFSTVLDGNRKLWRAHPDGSGRVQVTAGDTRDMSPHPSPDGKWLVYLSYGADLPADKAPAAADVEVRLMPVVNGMPDAGKTQVMAKLYGGAASLNLPAWAPNSKNFAFVSYAPIH